MVYVIQSSNNELLGIASLERNAVDVFQKLHPGKYISLLSYGPGLFSVHLNGEHIGNITRFPLI